ncbi:MAG: hypothetical protein QOI85_1056 [Chloroflexota bacterium]|jgi:hypothetical protein|nr:hypothetical protein [Gaiellales bacterium]MEA2651335.1 hypothetical protein [Chloroflexota bacterium]
MFWKRKAADRPEPVAAGEREALAPVRIYTADAIINGWVDLAGQRLSDVLNVEELVSVSSVPAQPTDDEWTAMERADLLLVVPPPHIADRRLRSHRVKRNMLVLSGHYVIRGLVHMVPGISLDSFLARSRQHFLPLTDTLVTSSKRSEIEDRHAALLVNVRSTAQELELEVLA